jgi:hypothetical protein
MKMTIGKYETRSSFISDFPLPAAPWFGENRARRILARLVGTAMPVLQCGEG